MIVRPLPTRLTNSADLAAAVSDETGSGALVFANSPTLVTPILGTPTSGTLTNCTGLPVGTGISGFGAGVATWLATPSSANLAAAVTGETGTGGLVFADSPVFGTQISTPQIVTASGNLTITPAGNANIILQGSGTGNVGIGTTSPTKLLQISGNSDSGATAAGIRLYDTTVSSANARNWEISGQGSNYGDLSIYVSVASGAASAPTTLAMVIDKGGNVGIGLTTPTAALHLKAGTAAVNTGPFKLTTSGTGITGLLTTAEKGAVEFSDYGLWFSPAASTRHKVWSGLIGATAPVTAAIGTIADYFGTSATRVLTTPNTWISVVGDNGATYKVPAYS